jgi:hypothetical protein
VNAVVGDERFGVENDPLSLVDEWRVPAPPVVPEFVDLPRENLYLVERLFEFLGLRTAFSADTRRASRQAPTSVIVSPGPLPSVFFQDRPSRGGRDRPAAAFVP